MTQSKLRALSRAPASVNVRHARSVSLVYVTDAEAGIIRRRVGASFRYVTARGKPVRQAAALRRIKSLVIPPAWTNVWICPLAKGHLQATGRDARGRKQYIYHPDWRRTRDATKYDRLAAFGAALPRIRRKVARDLRLPGLGRDRVLALLVRLLDESLVRVGNDEYATANGSYGLTTLTDRHARVASDRIEFTFRAKSGVRQRVHVRDAQLARLVRQCQSLPGQRLFQYKDDDGRLKEVSSTDVNRYLREAAGEDFTAKDFRTWHGTLIAARELCKTPPAETKQAREAEVVHAVRTAAARLGNTATVCRRCYIHPAVVTEYVEGTLSAWFVNVSGGSTLRRWERALLRFLRRRKSAR